MVRKFKVTITFLIIIYLFISVPVMANKTLIYDEAMLFSDSEKNNLEKEANKLFDLYNLDIVIVTTNDTNGKSPRDYADDYYDYGGFGVGSSLDGILFLIDMDNREPYISTTGLGIRYLTDKRVDSIIDGVFDDGLIQGDYYSAAMSFLSNTSYYLESGVPGDQYNEPENVKVKNRLTVMDFIISLLGGSSAAGVFFLSIKNKYKIKKTRNLFSYKSNSLVNLSSNEDKLIDTFVTHRIIPRPTNNSSSSTSGRSTTHTSSSGRTHGGGGSKGRKF